MIYVADFETVNDVNDCRVWSWGVCDVAERPGFYDWGIDLDGFMSWVETQHKPTIYFHNLKFDSAFILSWLFCQGFTHVKTNKNMPTKSFTTLMSDKGQMYELIISFKGGKKGNSVKFLDSFKLLPFKVSRLPKDFGFADEMVKGEIDYNKRRPLGYIPDLNEQSYQQRDVMIVAKCLYYIFQEGHTRMTVGANALSSYKETIGESNFKHWFPQLECDSYIRQSYRGGFTWCNPRIANKGVKTGMVFDVNSLYPWVLHSCLLPHGEPLFFTGKYEEDERYPLYVARCIIDIKLKPNHIPCLQIKRSYLYQPNQYIENTKQPTEVYLTSVDIDLIFRQYEVMEFIMLDGYKFQANSQMFRSFIENKMEQKIKAEKLGHMVKRTLAKLEQNNVYGKFGTNPNTQEKIPYLDESRCVKWELGEKGNRDPVYIPVATFVTAHARFKTITSAQQVYERFCYADTDSLHITGTTIPENLEVDKYKLGAWKMESVFRRAKFIRQKTYCEEIFNHEKRRWELHITCAGMPERCYKHVRFTNFKPGAHFKGHLSHKTVPGGVVLLPNEFTIK